MNHLKMFKRMQRLQGGDEDVSPDEKLKDLLLKYEEAIAALKRENGLDEAFARRAPEIPPILKKLPGQYQDYFPEEHEEVPIKRDRGRRYFDPGSLGEYSITAQGGEEEVAGPSWLPPGMRMDPSPKEAAGLYDPSGTPAVEPYEEMEYQQLKRERLLAQLAAPQLTSQEEAQEEQDWQANIQELLAITPNLDAEERQQILELNPKDWDDSTREKVGSAVDEASENAQQLTPELYPKQGYAGGTRDVMDLERGNWPVSEEELKTLPDWLAHLLRGIPKEHTHGSQREQFMPRSVPVFQGPQGKYYDPRYSRKDELIMAAKGTSDVQHLAGGESYLKPGALNDQWELPSGGGGGGAVNWYDDWLASKFGITGGQNFSGKPFERGDTGIDLPPVEGLIPGGPFAGWGPEGFNEWHTGTPPSGMNYPEFTGTTAGPGGQQLAYETTSYNIPGYGWVPRAQLNNAQASNNLWDYLNPWGGTSKGGSNTGAPTQRVIGTAVGTASNLIIPGLGFVTGPIARYITSLFQKNPGITREQVVQAVSAKAKEDPSLVAPPPAPSGGSGFDPWGNPDRGNNWSNDFGRGTAGPAKGFGGTQFGQFGTGFGTGTVGTRAGFSTAIGFGGSYGGGSNAGDTSRFMSGAGYNRPYSAEQWANMRGSKKYAAPTLSTAEGGITPQMGYDQYLQMFHPIGSVGSSTGYGGAAYSGGGPKGVGGGTPAFKPNVNQKVFAMGTSDVNPGLKLFHKQQRKEKTK